MLVKINPGFSIENYNLLKERSSYPTPYNKWYMIDTVKIHSVENLNANRISIQIKLSDQDPLVVDFFNTNE